MPVMIKKCPNCIPHEFQDKKYGKNKRVFNEKDSNSGSKATCTVCDKEI